MPDAYYLGNSQHKIQPNESEPTNTTSVAPPSPPPKKEGENTSPHPLKRNLKGIGQQGRLICVALLPVPCLSKEMNQALEESSKKCHREKEAFFSLGPEDL